MKSRKFLNWKFCGSNVGSDRTGSTTIVKEDTLFHINLLQKYYFCHVRNLSLQQSSPHFSFPNETFLIEIFIQTFLFQRSVLIFKGVFKECSQFPPSLFQKVTLHLVKH